MNLHLFSHSYLFCLFFSGPAFGANFQKYINYQQYGIIPRGNILDNFALYVLENFENDFQKEIAIPSNDLKDFKSSSQASRFNIAHPKSFSISLLLDMEILIEEDSVTLRKLLQSVGGHMIPLLARYQKSCNFLKDLVARMRVISVNLNSSEHLTRYYLIKRIPLLYEDSMQFEFSLDDWENFINLVNLLLKFALGKDEEVDSTQISRHFLDLSINSSSTLHEFVPIIDSFENNLKLLAFSKREINYGRKIHDLIYMEEPLILREHSFIKEVDKIVATNKYCILTTFSEMGDNVFIKRLVNFIRLYGIDIPWHSYNGLYRFLERIHLLKGLNSKVLNIIFQYAMMYNKNSKNQGQENILLNVIFEQNNDQLQILYDFLGIAKEVDSCSSKNQLIRNSLLKLGVNKTSEPMYKLAELMFSYLIQSENNKICTASFKQYVHSLGMEDYLNKIQIVNLIRMPLITMKLSTFLFQENDGNFFSIFAHGLISRSVYEDDALMYFFSSLMESYLGITTDTMFMLKKVKSPTTNWLVFTNLIKASKSKPFDFSYLFELFNNKYRNELEVLQHGKDFKSWCEVLFKALRNHIYTYDFLDYLIARSIEIHKKNF